MRIDHKLLRKIIKEELSNKILTEAEKEEKDPDWSPEDSNIPLPKKLEKVLDPELSPQKFAQLDQQLDTGGTPAQQAIAIDAFALNYADGDEGDAKVLLQKALQALPKLVAKETDDTNEGMGTSRMQQIIKEEIAAYVLRNVSKEK